MAGIDRASQNLIIELQLRDIEDLSKGKGRHYDTRHDLDIAMQLYQAELESLDNFYADRVMSQSIARAVIQDADAIADEIHPRERSRRGRRGKQRATDRDWAASYRDEDEDRLDPALLARLQAMYMDDERERVPGDEPESSSWAASRRYPVPSSPSRGTDESHRHGSQNTGPLRDCTACSDPFPESDLSRCPCSHDYCRGCIAELFSAAMKDESLFPPRCCGQRIPVDQNLAFLPASTLDEFRAKEIEYGTPNRTYCHRPTCSAFIPAAYIRGDTASCARCRSLTCTTCKGAAHDEDCPEDTATQEVLRVARENGWQRCRACKRMVELNRGCNHISCHCGAEFCYVCGDRWKTCDCPQWDEGLLVERAEHVVNRDAVAAQYDAAQRARAVRRMQQDLRDYHECGTHRWRGRWGRYRCDECRRVMPEFIYECLDCRSLACRRCIYNRLY